MGAALLAKVARASTGWPEASSVIAQAERLRKRTAPLAQRDAEAYEQALAALHLPDQLEPEVRSLAIGQVVGRAAEVPLVIAEAGADVATLTMRPEDERVHRAKGLAQVASAAARTALTSPES
jgi:formiminotetrahydrofolate cyclodeaminase